MRMGRMGWEEEDLEEERANKGCGEMNKEE